jgi:hypothetical protein
MLFCSKADYLYYLHTDLRANRNGFLSLLSLQHCSVSTGRTMKLACPIIALRVVDEVRRTARTPNWVSC